MTRLQNNGINIVFNDCNAVRALNYSASKKIYSSLCSPFREQTCACAANRTRKKFARAIALVRNLNLKCQPDKIGKRRKKDESHSNLCKSKTQFNQYITGYSSSSEILELLSESSSSSSSEKMSVVSTELSSFSTNNHESMGN